MKKRRSTIAFRIIAGIILVCGVIFMAFRFFESTSDRNGIEEFDIFQNQLERELEIIADYNKNKDTWTIQNPYIVTDPYDFNPLSALVLFEITHDAEIEVTIVGDDEYATFTYSKSVVSGRAEIPIIGLYAGRTNNILLRANFKDNTEEASEIEIKTAELPSDFQKLNLIESKPEKMEEGITLTVSNWNAVYTALIDHNAQVRGFISDKTIAHSPTMQLNNGNLLIAAHYTSDPIVEVNWLGKIFREYEMPRFNHHSLYEMPNGNILSASFINSIPTGATRQDTVVMIERETGKILKEYDFREILGFIPDPDAEEPEDWLLLNGVVYDEVNNAIIISGREKNAIVSIDADTSEINWILSQYYWANDYEHLRPYVLSPVGRGFEWSFGQHYPTVLSSNENAVSLMLFDNGRRRENARGERIPSGNNFSRAVNYRINTNNMTVEQIWQYGKARGAGFYSEIVSSAEHLGSTGNRLIASGSNEVLVDDVRILRSTVVEVTQNGEVVFEVAVSEAPQNIQAGTFKALRVPLFSSHSFNYTLGQTKGERLGQSFVSPQIDIAIDRIEMETPEWGPDITRADRQGNRLIITGNFRKHEEEMGLSIPYGGRIHMVLRNNRREYIFESNLERNTFHFNVDLSELRRGTYEIDFFTSDRYFESEYKIKNR